MDNAPRNYRLLIEAASYEDFLELIESVETPDLIAIYLDVFGQLVMHAVSGPYAGGITEFRYTHLKDNNFSAEAITQALRERFEDRARLGSEIIPIVHGQVFVS